MRTTKMSTMEEQNIKKLETAGVLLSSSYISGDLCCLLFLDIVVFPFCSSVLGRLSYFLCYFGSLRCVYLNNVQLCLGPAHFLFPHYLSSPSFLLLWCWVSSDVHNYSTRNESSFCPWSVPDVLVMQSN